MDDVDDILYGNLDEAPLIDSLVNKSEPSKVAETETTNGKSSSPTPPAIPSTASLDPSIVQIVGGDYAPAQQKPRTGLLDPNLSKMGKLFIGGLSWDTTDEGLRQYMQVYGEIEDCLVMKDAITNRSRGFAFLTFKDPVSVDKVLAMDHYIDGKKIDPKRAVPKEEYEKAEKVFVGGVHPDCDDEEFKEFFEQFGPVSDATIMHDRNTGRPRGFGFVTFKSWDSVQKALDAQATRGVLIRGKRVEVKPASLRNQPPQVAGFAGGYGGAMPGYGRPPRMPAGYPPMGYPMYPPGYGMPPDPRFYGQPMPGYGHYPDQEGYPSQYPPQQADPSQYSPVSAGSPDGDSHLSAGEIATNGHNGHEREPSRHDVYEKDAYRRDDYDRDRRDDYSSRRDDYDRDRRDDRGRDSRYDDRYGDSRRSNRGHRSRDYHPYHR